MPPLDLCASSILVKFRGSPLLDKKKKINKQSSKVQTRQGIDYSRWLPSSIFSQCWASFSFLTLLVANSPIVANNSLN